MTSPKVSEVTNRIKLKYAWEDKEIAIDVINPTMIEQSNTVMLNTGHVPPPLDGPIIRPTIPLGGGDKI